MKLSIPAEFKTLRPTGVFSAHIAKEVQEQFKQDLSDGLRFVLVDLHSISFMDSFGLGVLVSMHTKLRMAGGHLYLFNPSPQVKVLFEMTDMFNLLTVLKNHHECLNMMLRKPMSSSAAI